MEGPLAVMNLGIQLTLNPTPTSGSRLCPPHYSLPPSGFENLMASLLSYQLLKNQPLSKNANF